VALSSAAAMTSVSSQNMQLDWLLLENMPSGIFLLDDVTHNSCNRYLWLHKHLHYYPRLSDVVSTVVN
jgi:hypothetical protein